MDLTLHLITPEKTSSYANLSTVTIPSAQWQIEILPWHTRLVTTLQPGSVFWQEQKQYEDLDAYKEHTQNIVINWWIAHCAENEITIITE